MTILKEQKRCLRNMKQNFCYFKNFKNAINGLLQFKVLIEQEAVSKDEAIQAITEFEKLD